MLWHEKLVRKMKSTQKQHDWASYSIIKSKDCDVFRFIWTEFHENGVLYHNFIKSTATDVLFHETLKFRLYGDDRSCEIAVLNCVI